MTTTDADSERAVLHAELVERARALAPKLRARAPEAEAERKIPRVSVDEIVDAGLGGRMLTPKRFGGDELTLDTQYEVAVELGKGCASTSWCATLLPHSCHIVGLFPLEAQEAVWADGPDPNIAASLPPAAKVSKVDGGYRLTGDHPFASGVDHASWVIVSGLIHSGDGPPVNHQFLIKPGDYTIRDTWFAAGMRGTGSKTIVIEDVFVPENLKCAAPALISGRCPGSEVNPGPLYSLPLAIHGGLTFIGPAVGATRGAYEYFVEWTRDRKTERGASVAESEVVQEAIALAAADIDAADLLVREGLRLARRPEPTTLEERAVVIRNYTRATQLLTGALDRLFKQSGTRAFMDVSPLQQMWRDVHMMVSHVAFTRDNLNHFGRLALGMERDPRMLIY
jgi:alkylation response protein AidB-like acyl-CoA dehydrogenase